MLTIAYIGLIVNTATSIELQSYDVQSIDQWKELTVSWTVTVLLQFFIMIMT